MRPGGSEEKGRAVWQRRVALSGGSDDKALGRPVGVAIDRTGRCEEQAARRQHERTDHWADLSLRSAVSYRLLLWPRWLATTSTTVSV